VAEAVPLGQVLTRLARADPGRPAITSAGQTITRAELEARANRLARAYEAHGARPGDLVTVALPNGIEFYAAVFALWKLGAIPQLMSPALPARERDEILALAAPPLVIGAGPAAVSGAVRLPPGYLPDPGLSDAPIEPARVSPSWKAPTSGGSTGRPKLIVSGLRGEIDPGYYGEALGQRDGGVQLVCGPLYHNAPFNFSMYGLLSGQHLIVLPRFDTIAALDLIKTFRVDWISLVPTMMSRIARELELNPGRHDISSLRAVWHGAAPCPAWVKRAWISLVGARNLHEMYGTTEGQMMTHIDGIDWLAHPGSVGRPLWGEVKILGPDATELPPGAEGGIYTRTGDGQPPGYQYIGAEARQIGGWDSVGDLGWLDPQGYLYISDRRTDLIISGGANVYPAEVEAALSEHPGVASSVVIGLSDSDLGQRVHAVVEAAAAIPDDELRAFLAERLARYKIPRGFTFTGEPLRDDAGKVRRSDVRARFAPPLSG
jgi:bile acid-coenzyme A ligase